MITLTQDEKNRIRAEEIFREEVTKEIEARQAKDGKILKFLNSGFGLWILSTIALGVFSWTWTSVQEHFKTKSEDQKKLVQLKVELAQDFREFQGSLGPAWDYTRYAKSFEAHLQRPRYHYSRFKDQPVGELLWTMGSIPPAENPRRAQSLERSIAAIWGMIGPLQFRDGLSPAEKAELDRNLGNLLDRDVYPLLEK